MRTECDSPLGKIASSKAPCASGEFWELPLLVASLPRAIATKQRRGNDVSPATIPVAYHTPDQHYFPAVSSVVMVVLGVGGLCCWGYRRLADGARHSPHHTEEKEGEIVRFDKGSGGGKFHNCRCSMVLKSARLC